ncbi:hypothetical protein PENTCL1PPCAC_11982, partial [Pristionchus entomophagus]
TVGQSIMGDQVVAMKLASGSEIRYLSQWAIDVKVCQSSFANDASLKDLERSDLTTHVYEGGFKVWECARDLCELIEQEPEIVKGKNVLELGCGAGLPSIVALKEGAETVLMQDFNGPVLECFTLENVRLNGLDTGRCHFVAGPWTQLRETVPERSADVILSSETIYNENDYESLHDSIAHALKEDGIALIGAKMFYFGLSGCAPAFSEYVKTRGILNVKEKKIIQASVPRIILELARVR